MGGPAFIDNKFIDELDNWYTIYIIDNKGIEYSSVEHYYQSHKCINDLEKQNILKAKSAREAYILGRECLLRDDWLQVRNRIMFEGNLLKINQYTNLKKILIESQGDIIYPGKDPYWSGDIFGKSQGKNRFGIILMAVRSLLRGEKEKFIEYCNILNINPNNYLI